MNKSNPTALRPSFLSDPRAAPSAPALRFSPTAWGKLVYLRDLGPTEVGGFAISAADDLLLIEDIQMVSQECSPVTVRFDDHAVADFFDRQIDAGRRPEQFSRIWVHTHPDNCPLPSGTDERTFARVFGEMQWAVMFILARGGQSYARLRFNVGPRGDLPIPVRVEFSRPFGGCDCEAWKREYQTHLNSEYLDPRRRNDSLADRRSTLLGAPQSSQGTDDLSWDQRFANAHFGEEEFFYEC